MPFLKLAEQTTALVNSSYAVGTLGHHFRAVLFIRWQSNPRARELSQLMIISLTNVLSISVALVFVILVGLETTFDTVISHV